jgi:hypothetical protein
MGAPFDERYFSPASALLSFALGATVYFALKDDARPADVKLGAPATAGWSTCWQRGRSFQKATPFTAVSTSKPSSPRWSWSFYPDSSADRGSRVWTRRSAA